MAVTISGLFSGLDTGSIINAIIAADSIPITNLQSQESTINIQESAFNAVGASLTALQTSLQKLSDPATFRAKVVSSSNTTVATASADSTATNQSVNINITQMASDSVLRGGNSSGSAPDTKVTAIPAATANLGTVMNETISSTNNTFTINGVKITIDSATTLNSGADSVVSLINASTAGVTAAYSATTGKFTITSNTANQQVILGLAPDTSDFLQQAQLFTNNNVLNGSTYSVTSTVGMGRLNTNNALSTFSFRSGTALAASGAMLVNGVSINWTNGETLSSLLSGITSSNAGVIATYDSFYDRIVLTDKSSGSTGISVSDSSGNLAAALRLTSSDSQLSTGNPTLFTVGSDPTVRQSQYNTLTAAATGVQGLTVTALATGTTTLTIGADVTGIKQQIDAFVNQYNAAQTLIGNDVHINVTDLTQNGILASDPTLTFLPSNLRATATSQASSTNTYQSLLDLGITGNSNDNTLTTSDSSKLSDALNNHLSDVIYMFTDSTNGVVAKLNNVLNGYNNSANGVIATHVNDLNTQTRYINNQIESLQLRIAAERVQLEKEFAALEQFQSGSQGFNSILGGGQTSFANTFATPSVSTG